MNSISCFLMFFLCGFVSYVNAATTPLLTNAAWPKYRANLQNTGNSLDPVSGSGRLNVPGGSLVGNVRMSYLSGASAAPGSPVIDSNGNIYFGTHQGFFLFSLNPIGTVKWQTKPGGIPDEINTTPLLDNNNVLYAGSITLNNMYAVSQSTGVLIWKYNEAFPIYSSAAISSTGAYIYYGSDGNFLVALTTGPSPTGGVVSWRYTTGGKVRSSPAVSATSGKIFFGCMDNYVYAISASGSLLWKMLTGGSILSSPLLSTSDTVYIGSGDSYLYAYSSAGALLWQTLLAAVVDSSPAFDPSSTYLYVGCNSNSVYKLLAATGAIQWTYNTVGGGSIGQSSPAVGADGNVCK